MRRVLLFLAFVSTLVHADCYWDTVIDVEGRIGNYRRGVDIVVWTALMQGGSDLLYVQGGGGYWRDHLYDGNVGLGYRAKLNDCLAWGANAFIDITAAEHGETYWQGGLGGELMGNCWLVRANGYLPTNNRTIIHEWTVANPFLIGNQVWTADTHYIFQEQAYRGFDIEAGAGWDFLCGQLWGFGSFFYFDASRVREFYGPRARLEYRLYDLCLFGRPIDLMIGGEYEWNRLHGHTGSATAWVRIPFGGDESPRYCCNSLCKQMGDPVIRERSIWVDRQKFHRSEVLDLVQQLLPVTPDTQLATLIEKSREGDIFVLQRDRVDVTGLENTTWQLKKDQSIFGSGPVIVRGGRTLHLPLGDASTLVATPTSPAITPCAKEESTNRIAGLNFGKAAQAVGSTAPIAGTVHLENLTIEENKGTHTIDLVSKGAVTIKGGDLQGTGMRLVLTDDAKVSIEGVESAGVINIAHSNKGSPSVRVADVHGQGVEFITSGEGGDHTFMVENCTLDGQRAIHLNTQLASGTTTFAAKNNRINTEGTALLLNAGSIGTTKLDVTMKGNQVVLENEAAGIVGNIGLEEITDQLSWKVSNNSVSGDGTALEVTGLTSSVGMSRLELKNNNFTTTKGLSVETQGGFAGHLEVALDGNSSEEALTITNSGDGSLKVDDLPTLLERNDLPVTGSGFIDS